MGTVVCGCSQGESELEVSDKLSSRWLQRRPALNRNYSTENLLLRHFLTTFQLQLMIFALKIDQNKFNISLKLFKFDWSVAFSVSSIFWTLSLVAIFFFFSSSSQLLAPICLSLSSLNLLQLNNISNVSRVVLKKLDWIQ